MIKSRSKPKLKQSVNVSKKSFDEKAKKTSKDLKRGEEKENNIYPKFSTSAFQSKKKTKNNGEADTERDVSPLCLNKKGKNEDEKFIEQLFQKTDKNEKEKEKKEGGFLVERLIENLVPEKGRYSFKNPSQNYESISIVKELQLKNQEVTSLKQEIEELKLYISNFIFKVFDLTVLCRKNGDKIDSESENIEFTEKTDEVIAYLDSLVRHWKLEETIKNHCESMAKASTSSGRKKSSSQKRCHTESLKIPIEDYLQTLKATSSLKFEENFESFKKRAPYEEEQSEEIMKILSRRSSARVQKEEEEIYTAVKCYEAENEHELCIRIGDKVSILQKNDNMKWLGFKDGKVGYFPKECILP